MGFIVFSINTASARTFMVSLVVLGLVFTVALFQGTNWSDHENVDNGLTVRKQNTLRKLLMINMGTVTGDNDGDGNGSVAAGDPSVNIGFGNGDGDGNGNGVDGGNRTMNGGISVSNTCTRNNIALNQGPTAPLPNGIPTYTVIVENVCMSGCSVSDIHLRCEWFSSARTINPHIFRRLEYDDCLLNDGNPLHAGSSLSFQYANTFPFQLSVSKLTCLSTSTENN